MQGLLRIKSVLKITGLSRSGLYARIAAGDFPKAIKIGPRSSAWISTEISDWIKARIEKSRSTSNKHTRN